MPFRLNPTLKRKAVTEANARGPEARHRAIVADDDTALRQLLGDCLRQVGFEVLEVRDGLELMAAIGKLRGTFFPDVVITDINMPNCNGLSALHAIRGILPRLKTIVITAFPDEVTNEAAKKIGATVLAKPLDLREIQDLALATCEAH
jgi:CheY-like chemotaxis protein